MMASNDRTLLGSIDPVPNRASLLFVCSANRCRSPYAAAIASDLAAGAALDICSAGLLAPGQRMPDPGRALGRELGFDFEEHRSRRLDPGNLRGFDLILTATRAHSRDLLTADSALWPRVFTIKQFARWAAEHQRPRRAQLGPWIDVVARKRPRSEAVGASPKDDLFDPVNQPIKAWRRMAADLYDLNGTILEGLYPSHVARKSYAVRRRDAKTN